MLGAWGHPCPRGVATSGGHFPDRFLVRRNGDRSFGRLVDARRSRLRWGSLALPSLTVFFFFFTWLLTCFFFIYYLFYLTVHFLYLTVNFLYLTVHLFLLNCFHLLMEWYLSFDILIVIVIRCNWKRCSIAFTELEWLHQSILQLNKLNFWIYTYICPSPFFLEPLSLSGISIFPFYSFTP